MISRGCLSCLEGNGIQEGGWGQGCPSQHFLGMLDNLSTGEDQRNREGGSMTSHLTSTFCREWVVTVAALDSPTYVCLCDFITMICLEFNTLPHKAVVGERICIEKSLLQVAGKWPGIVQNQLLHIQLLSKGIGVWKSWFGFVPIPDRWDCSIEMQF